MNAADATGIFTLSGVGVTGLLALLGQRLIIKARTADRIGTDNAARRDRREDVFARYLADAQVVNHAAFETWRRAGQQPPAHPPGAAHMRQLLDALSTGGTDPNAVEGLSPDGLEEVTARLNSLLLTVTRAASHVVLVGSTATNDAVVAHLRRMKDLCNAAAIAGDFVAADANTTLAYRAVIDSMRLDQGVTTGSAAGYDTLLDGKVGAAADDADQVRTTDRIN